MFTVDIPWCGEPATDSFIFIHKGSLSVNGVVIQEAFYDVCGWSHSQPKQDSTVLDKDLFGVG